MSTWKEIEVVNRQVIVDGISINVGQRMSMGLGSIELRKTSRAGLHIVRLSARGHFKYCVKLGRDGLYRLGPDRGHRVVSPNEEQDPIKRILREMRISVSKLQLMKEGEGLAISTLNVDIACATREGEWQNRFVTDGTENTGIVSREQLSTYGRRAPAERREGSILGATYAIDVVSQLCMASRIVTYVAKVFVWPNCNPMALANALAPIVFGPRANGEYPRALENFEAACEWIAKNLTIETGTQGDTLLVDGCEFPVEVSDGTPRKWAVQALDRLVRKHGVRLLEKFLGDAQCAFIRAKTDLGEATKYVTQHYRVVKVENEKGSHLRFAPWSRLNDLLELSWVLSSSLDVHRPLAVLYAKHRQQLLGSLEKVTQERMELISTWGRRDGLLRSDGVLVDANETVRVHLQGVRSFWKSLSRASKETFSMSEETVSGTRGEVFGALCDGGEVYRVREQELVFFLRPKEEKTFFFTIARAPNSLAHGVGVFALKICRAEDGTLTYSPLDETDQYTCVTKPCHVDVLRVKN